MQYCTKCVLNERFPGISFDEEGICNICRSSKTERDLAAKRTKFENKFLKLAEKYRGRGSYDCLVAYSGGKDSTFTLHLMKEKYDLSVLAFSFDNWFQSEAALVNIRNVIKNMDIDHLTIRPNYKVFKEMINECLKPGFYSTKALERASAICTTCILQIRFLATKMAIEKKIPFVVFGLSPGQSSIAASVFKNNSDMTRKMQDTVYQPMFKSIGEKVKPYFLEERHFEDKDNFPYSINPLAFTSYDETDIYEIIKQYEWFKPEDTDSNSTNCLLNGIANEAHIKQLGYHPYAYEMAGLVREGCLDREEGMRRIYEKSDQVIVGRIGKELGIEKYLP